MRQVFFEANPGQMIAIVGPSGAGKTTIAALIPRFYDPQQGTIYLDGVDIRTVTQKSLREQMAIVPQETVLFNRSVYENIRYGRLEATREEVVAAAKAANAHDFITAMPQGYETPIGERGCMLSGGQRQRIAIARAIVNEPKVLLLDEPLSALDLKLRQSMQRELVKIKKELGITFVFVTHDQQEALSMSDTVVVMNQGWIQQIGTPESVYNEPENAFVADFIGDSNIIDGMMVRDKLVHLLGQDIPCINTGFGENVPVDVQIRPEDIQICEPEDGQFRGVIRQVVFKGTVYDITIEAGGFRWLVQTITGHEQGREVGLRLAASNIQIMAKPASEDEEAATDE